jgi:glutamate synthase (NADPH/NADH) small chain
MPVRRADKTPMPVQDAQARARNFLEVNAGYTVAHAAIEAERCLRCQYPVCVDGCPVHIPIRDFIHAVAAGNMPEAARILRAANPLPAICGRVCPQESQCEAECSMGGRFEPVAIGHLERFVADWERTRRHHVAPALTRSQKIAVIGAGPSGLVCAGELARLGYPVTVYEALHAPGGVLRYGIPEFRLPKAVLDWEIDILKAMGVEIVCNVIIGKTLALDDLTGRLGFSAIFIGTGAGLPQFLGIPGENLNGVYSANEFLTRINLMRADLFPTMATPVLVGRSVVVVGGGNTAMDCVRTSRRMGCEHVVLLYRRTDAEMPARREEIEHAKEEGALQRRGRLGAGDGMHQDGTGRAGRQRPPPPGRDRGQQFQDPRADGDLGAGLWRQPAAGLDDPGAESEQLGHHPSRRPPRNEHPRRLRRRRRHHRRRHGHPRDGPRQTRRRSDARVPDVQGTRRRGQVVLERGCPARQTAFDTIHKIHKMEMMPKTPKMPPNLSILCIMSKEATSAAFHPGAAAHPPATALVPPASSSRTGKRSIEFRMDRTSFKSTGSGRESFPITRCGVAFRYRLAAGGPTLGSFSKTRSKILPIEPSFPIPAPSCFSLIFGPAGRMIPSIPGMNAPIRRES